MTGPLLLTPGPISTHADVRGAMMQDLGSRDPAFIALTSRVRAGLLALLPEPEAFTAVPVQGSGTYAVEAMLGTLIARDEGALVVVHGVYGARAAEILERAGRPVLRWEVAEEEALDLEELESLLIKNMNIKTVVAVHCETTTGTLEPLQEISDRVARQGRRLLVDTMSGFGALSLEGVVADAYAASANKCLEGAPGLAFVLVRRSVLEASAGRAHSVSLDLHAQWSRMERDGQFRMTPPTHVLLALAEALRLHAEEGGVEGRGRRYRENLEVLVTGMRALGFEPLVPPERQAPIIVTFRQPSSPAWHFPTFYAALRARGFAIYPGGVSRVPSFRVGCIGQVFPDDLRRFVEAAGEACALLGLHPSELR